MASLQTSKTFFFEFGDAAMAARIPELFEAIPASLVVDIVYTGICISHVSPSEESNSDTKAIRCRKLIRWHESGSDAPIRSHLIRNTVLETLRHASEHERGLLFCVAVEAIGIDAIFRLSGVQLTFNNDAGEPGDASRDHPATTREAVINTRDDSGVDDPTDVQENTASSNMDGTVHHQAGAERDPQPHLGDVKLSSDTDHYPAEENAPSEHHDAMAAPPGSPGHLGDDNDPAQRALPNSGTIGKNTVLSDVEVDSFQPSNAPPEPDTSAIGVDATPTSIDSGPDPHGRHGASTVAIDIAEKKRRYAHLNKF